MPGFFIANTENHFIPDNLFQENCIKDQIVCPEHTISRNTLNKYLDDKPFFQTADHIIIIEGVILNKSELMAEYACSTFKDAVLAMLALNPESFFGLFRGMFSGGVYFKRSRRWLFFTDHSGGRAVFYYVKENAFYVGSHLTYISEALLNAGIERRPCLAFFQYKAKHGYQLDERTAIDGVYRLKPGSKLVIENGQCHVSQYSTISNAPDGQINWEEAIEDLNTLFRRAIKRGYEKDKEYGYLTHTDISGGMDSRGVAFVSASLGYRPALTTCFSQIGSRDQRISEEIAQYLGANYLFFAMNQAQHLMEVDDIIAMNSGTSYYAGIGAMKMLLESLDTSKLGLSINGICGDTYLGAYPFGEKADDGYNRYSINDDHNSKAYSRLLSIQLDESCMEGFENIEQFVYTMKEGYGSLSTNLIKQHFLEPYSPYADVDFMRKLYSLPRTMRINESIKMAWFARKYPEMMTFRYAMNGYPPMMRKETVQVLEFPKRALRKLMRSAGIRIKEKGMNPLELWFQTLPEMRDYLNSYFTTNQQRIQKYPEIAGYTGSLYNQGTAMEKLLAISLLAVCKVYCD